MVVFPNAKINLGLHIQSKRQDGYHNIESLLYPIPWCDALEVIESGLLKFESSGLDIPGSIDSNLCLKAYHLLKESYDLPPVHIHLHKAIPMGAGLGGGSADGAFMITLLNELFELQLSDEKMEVYASELGSDCPFFVKNRPALASGRGIELEPFDIDLTGNYIACIVPDVHVSTKEAYSGVIPEKSKKELSELLLNQGDWRSTLINDFENSILENHPEIKKSKMLLDEGDAWYTAMSGSGSTVFGLFKNKPSIDGARIMEL